MDGDRTARALARIEAASVRIDAAVQQHARSTWTEPAPLAHSGDTELQQRFDRLQRAAREALNEIDALIERLEE